MRKIKLILVVVLVFTFVFAKAVGRNVKAYDDQKTYIEQYNLNHTQYLLNEAFNKAVLLNKNSTSAKPVFSADGGSFYTEGFDHYVFGNGYKQLRGYLINYVVARGGPQTIEVSTDYLRSYAASVQVDGEVTTELKNAIIGGISTKLGVSTTWQTTAQSNIHIGSTAQVPAGTDTYTLSMWYIAVSSSGTAYYRWYTVDGQTGVDARPCGSLVPCTTTNGNYPIYFDFHKGSNP